MKHFRFRFPVLLLALCLLLPLGGCSNGKARLVLITGPGGVSDRWLIQASYSGISAYGDSAGKVYGTSQAVSDTTEGYLDAARAAVKNGAETLVFAGQEFAEAVSTLQGEYPNVDFLLVECRIDRPGNNVWMCFFNGEQAGYLTGYAAVAEGYTALGIVCGPESELTSRITDGFLQGAGAAASEKSADVTVKLWYSEQTASSDALRDALLTWYQEGTEGIFVCGANLCRSAVSAANTYKAHTLGAVMDQASLSERFLISGMLDVEGVLNDALTSLSDNNGKWDNTHAGKSRRFGVRDGAVYLPTNIGSFRLSNWTVEEYGSLLTRLRTGDITVRESGYDATALNVETVDLILVPEVSGVSAVSSADDEEIASVEEASAVSAVSGS